MKLLMKSYQYLSKQEGELGRQVSFEAPADEDLVTMALTVQLAHGPRTVRRTVPMEEVTYANYDIEDYTLQYLCKRWAEIRAKEVNK